MTSMHTRGRRTPGAAVQSSAVSDAAHVGDIVGAFGRIRRDGGGADGAAGGRWRRLRTLAVITGPGLIVMVGDNDAGGSRPTRRPARTTAWACCGRWSC